MKTALHQSESIWKIALVPRGLLAASEQQQKKKKKLKDAGISHRCCCCLGKLLSATQKGTVQIQDRRVEHMQITDWMRLLLSPTALQSDQEDEGKSRKSAPFWKQSEVSWGKKKKEGRKKNKFSLSSAAIIKAKMGINEKLQNLKSLLHKNNTKVYSPKLWGWQFQLSPAS